MVTAMLLLQPFPVPCSSSTISCPYSPPLTSFNLLGFFKLLTAPAHTHPSPLPRPASYFLPFLLIFFISVLLPDPYGSTSPPRNFSPLSQQMGQGEQDTSSARPPPSSSPLPEFPSCLTAAPRAGSAQSGRILAQKPTTALLQFPSPDSWCRPGLTQGSPRETQEHPFQTDRFTLNYEMASFPHLQPPAVLAVPGGAATKLAQCRWCPQHPEPC